MTAQFALTEALARLADEGRRPVCSDDSEDLWFADDPAGRARAAQLCTGCPVNLECYAASAEVGERFGVWGGIDRSRRTGVSRS